MADTTNIPTGLSVQTQIPLNTIKFIQNESLLSNLGQNNNLAFKYYDGLIIKCIDQNTFYIWREVQRGEENTGIINVDFTYPFNHSAFGMNYSNKKFNFFLYNKEYSIVNIGSGVGIFKDKTISFNNTQFNLKKIKTDNLLITDGTADILINQKKLKSTDGSVTITESIADIDFSVSGVVTPDGSETKVVGGTNTTITGVGTTLNPYVVNSITKINNGVTTTVFGNGSILTPFIVETTNPQKVITSNHVLSNLDNNYVLFINTSSDITITIPIGLADNFQCGFIQETSFETAFVSVIGVTLKNPIGFRIKGQKYNVFLEKKLATETYYLLGNTKI